MKVLFLKREAMKKTILIINFLFFILLISCTKLAEYSGRTIFLFDTNISIKFYNTEDSEKHYDNIKKLLMGISKIADDYNPYGNNELKSVYDLNENRVIPLNEELKDMIDYANVAKEKTNGYFEPLIGSLARIWKDALENKTIPNEEIIKKELQIIHTSKIVIDENEIKIIGDANLDLGGFIKGYTSKKVYDYLQENGVKNYLINLGDSTILAGSKVNDDFNIGFKNPINHKIFFSIKAKNVMISTSSIEYQSQLIDQNLYHHLISPFDGYPKNYYSSVSVIKEDDINLDAFSTAIFSMNKDEAIKFSKENNIKIILFNDTMLYKSDGLNYD